MAIISEEKRDGCFPYCVLAFMCVHLYVCFLEALPHGAMGWSVICNCGISWSHSLFLKLFPCLQLLLPSADASSLDPNQDPNRHSDSVPESIV